MEPLTRADLDAAIQIVMSNQRPDLWTPILFGAVGFVALAAELWYVAWRFKNIKDRNIEGVPIRKWYKVWSVALAVVGVGGILAGITELPFVVRQAGVIAFAVAADSLPIVWGFGIAAIIEDTLEREEALQATKGRIARLHDKAEDGERRFALNGGPH